MKSFTESHKPIHTLLSIPIKNEESIVLEKDTFSLKKLPYQEAKKINERKLEEKVSEEIKVPLLPVNAVKRNKFLETLSIWLQFWGRSALYLCIISFVVGTSLSVAYFYKIEINLDKLLTVYIASSFILWFFLTPIALYRSLRKVIRN